jgi:sugar lactone lactonase YvrE
MLHKSVITFVMSCALAITSLPLAAQLAPQKALPDNVPALLVKANEAFVAKDYLTFRRALQALHQMRPYNSDYMYQLVIANALLNDKQPAYDLMLRMQQQGLSYDFSANDDTLNIRGTEVFDYVNELMEIAAQPMGEVESVFTLPESVLMPETITWDESRQKFLVGTLVEGSVLAVSMDGEVSELIKANNENGMWGVFDVLVDEARNRLWVSSAATRAFVNFSPADKGRSALFEFDLETLQLLRRYPVPVDGSPHILGSMVLGPEGDIYIMDRYLPILYKKPAGEEKLETVLGVRNMVSMRGMAMSADGSFIYVADREMGILVVDVKGGRAGILAMPENFNPGGIDGLYYWDNHLVIIQNGLKPQRVMRLQLDEGGTKVIAVRPLAVAQPQFDFPSYGTLRGEDLYYFANSQSATAEGKKKAVTVLRTPLNSSQDLVEPSMQQFMNQQVRDAEKRLKEEQQSKKDNN